MDGFTNVNLSQAANKKGASATAPTPATEAEAPPTPTPATPITPMHPANLSQNQANKNLPNGQPPSQQQQQQQQPPQPQQLPPPDMSGPPFGSLTDPNDQFGMSGMNMDFANLEGGDVLDNFDFDSFLNTAGDGDGGFAFDANLAFGDGTGLEAGGDLGGN